MKAVFCIFLAAALSICIALVGFAEDAPSRDDTFLDWSSTPLEVPSRVAVKAGGSFTVQITGYQLLWGQPNKPLFAFEPEVHLFDPSSIEVEVVLGGREEDTRCFDVAAQAAAITVTANSNAVQGTEYALSLAVDGSPAEPAAFRVMVLKDAPTTILGTRAGGGVTGPESSAMSVGGEISLVFDEHNFVWSADTSGEKDYANLNPEWIHLENAVLGTDFSAKAGPGGLVALKALRPGTYSLRVFLDSGDDGAATTAADFAIIVKSLDITPEPPEPPGQPEPPGPPETPEPSVPAETGEPVGNVTGQSKNLSLHFASASNADPENLSVYTGQVLTIPLTADMFEGMSGDGSMPLSILRKGKVTVRTSASSGKTLLSAKLDTCVLPGLNKKNTACIKIEFIEHLLSVEKVDFSVHVYLSVDGQGYRDQGILLAGTISNEELQVYGEDEVDLSGGQVAVANQHNRGVTVRLGNGVSVLALFFQGQKYYGVATVDAPALAEYPTLELCYTLHAIGLRRTGNVVKLDPGSGGYYVYDEHIRYLGTTDELLPYAEKYYLARKKLDATDGTGEAQAVAVFAPSKPVDASASKQQNENPRTGR